MYGIFVGIIIGVSLSFVINIVRYLSIIKESIASEQAVAGVVSVAIDGLSISLSCLAIGLVVGFILWVLEP